MIGKIRFFMGLWASKFYLWISKLRGAERDDRAGLLAYRFSNDFIKHIKKPKLMIGITGTNGKSTITSMVNDFLTKEGYKVQYNDWFANALAGHARCLLDAVTIFNHPRVDAAILELDEKTLAKTMAYVDLDYLIVTNLSSDSLKRNGYPSYIVSKVKEGFDSSKKTKIILNADDPLCSFIPHENPTIYYSIDQTKKGYIEHNVNDFPVCPKCFHKVEYEYQHYRHIGKIKCPNCGFHSIKGDYVGSKIDYEKETFIVTHGKEKEEYPIISNSLFNVFNELSIIALFSDMGYSNKTIKKNMKDVKVPSSRENFIEAYGKKIDLQVAKGQNGSSASTVFEHISHMDDNMEIILLLTDRGYLKSKKETVTWIYETDFFFLNRPNIKKIIVGNYLAEDYKTAMMLNGIPEEKIVIAKDDEDTINYLSYDGIDRIMILFDVEYITGSLKLRDQILEKLKERVKQDEN